MKAIEIRNLNKTFSQSVKSSSIRGRFKQIFKPEVKLFSAVNGISIDVEQGETVAFIGPNGAGKSTTIKILTGILNPSSGEAKVLGLIPWKERIQLAYQIGCVFGQKSQLWMHLPAVDTFNLLAKIYNIDKKKYERRKNELIHLFELKEFLHLPIRKLSLGQRMRCEVAASLLHEPKMIFLDEPTIGLDPVAKNSIRDLIKKSNREEGVTVFLTSHDSGDIEHLCKRVIIINHGEVIYDDSTLALKKDYLKKKEIDLKLVAPWQAVDLEGVAIAKQKGFGIKLNIDLNLISIEKAVHAILKTNQVEDITIQNVELEEIITNIYLKKKRV